MTTYDAIVVGLGAMGSAATYALARRGIRVLGIDMGHPPHALGSSHGRTRIIREAYYEHPLYVPMVQRSLQLWLELERSSGTELYRQTGGLMAGAPDCEVVTGALRSARQHHLPHELLDAPEVARRFPAIRLGPGMVALHEKRAGLLFAEECQRAFLNAARACGAQLQPGMEVLGWQGVGAHIAVRTREQVLHARRLVLAAGPWMPRFLPENIPLSVERQFNHWFLPLQSPAQHAAAACPLVLWEYEKGKMAATFPDVGHGIKIIIHHDGEITSADAVRRTTSPAEEMWVRSLLERFIPDANGRLIDSSVCLYTNTPDRHFVIGSLPEDSRVTVVSPCSGHGFKFATVVGEIVADMVCDKQPEFDVTPFRPDRFA